MVDLRSFDAFPKVKSTYRVQTIPNLFGSSLLGLVALFILWLITTDWMGARPQQQFSVDRGITDKFQINLDISVASKCESTSVFIQDIVGDRLFVDELVEIRPDFATPLHIYGPAMAGEEWCRITGIFETNRVRARLGITGPLQGFLFPGVKPGTTFQPTNYIYELSFGTYFPQQLNPLDGVLSEAPQNSVMLYFLKIVPTTVQILGMTMETYMYSVTESLKEHSPLLKPGLYFDFDFDPMKITITDKRLSFFGWLFRLSNIIGGLCIAAAWFDGIRPRRELRDEKGLLD